MEKSKLLSISIIVLALSIVFGSIYIGNSIKEAVAQNTSAEEVSDILDFEGAAEYLNLSKSELASLIADHHTGINYVRIKNKYIFNKEALDLWLQSTRLEINQ